MNAPISVIVAVSENGVIGKDGKMPWRIPDDMRRFRRLTMGKPCIMGRKTWDSIPNKPLAGRTNIVLTRKRDFVAEDAKIAHSFDEAATIAQSEEPEEIMILGGEAVYAEALMQANRIYLTEVDGACDGDAFLPLFNRARWHETAHEGPFSEGGYRYSYVTLERK